VIYLDEDPGDKFQSKIKSLNPLTPDWPTTVLAIPTAVLDRVKEERTKKKEAYF
jgi:hypothetical protein